MCSDGSAVTRSTAFMSRDGSRLLAQMLQHHGRGPERPDRVRDALAGDVEGGAVDGLEHRGRLPLRVQVRGRGDPERASQRRREVRQDVSMQVGRDDRIQRLRLHGHSHGHRVDQHLVPRHVRKILGDLGGNLIPHHHGMALRVALGHHREQLARTRLGQLEGEANDPVHSGSRHDGDVGGHLFRQAPMDAATYAGIFAFGVLAHDDPVQFRTGDMTQRAGDARQNPGRTNVGILIKRLADRQTQTPQGDVVRDVGSADRTKQDGVEFAQLIGAVCRHHDAVLFVVVRAPVEILEFQLELTIALGAGFESLHSGRDDLWPYSISAHCGNPVSTHLLLLVLDELLLNLLTLNGGPADLLHPDEPNA